MLALGSRYRGVVRDENAHYERIDKTQLQKVADVSEKILRIYKFPYR
jgi:hypothetical protein